MNEGVSVRWKRLVRFVNDRSELIGEVGVRDPEYRCAGFDGEGYDGRGDCQSDGHYMCVECSLLSPDSPRFEDYSHDGRRDGRRDRLLLFWRRKRRTIQ